MIKLDQKAEILMKYFRENMSQRAIAREMKVSRTTVRKYIKDYDDCMMPVELKKHGYYKRFFISKDFTGIVYIRRYICPVCGRTVSMLPMFCLPYFQYSALDILNILYEFYVSGNSLESLIRKVKGTFPYMERRHVNYYRRRLNKTVNLYNMG